MNFIAMDFETASGASHSACSVALVMVKDNQFAGQYYSLIKPTTPMSYHNSQIHGISEEDVRDAPTFDQVWQDIERYFQANRLIVAHNASFDNRVLRACLDYYDLAPAHFMSLCTVKTSRRLYPNLKNHKLNTVCRYLGIDLENHHHALDDSRACSEILLTQEQTFGVAPLKKLVTHV